MKLLAIHGVPRSGTSWLGSIIDSSPNVAYRHQPLFSYAFKSYLNEYSSGQEIECFFNKIANSNDDFINQKEAKLINHVPEFQKYNITHIAYKEARYHHIIENLLNQHGTIRVIGIIRNPKSVISSWRNAPKEFMATQWDIHDEWRDAQKKNKGRKEEFYGFNKWKEVAELFLKLQKSYPHRFLLITYEMLVEETEEVVKKLFDFCELQYGDQTKRFLVKSQSTDLSENAYSVYRTDQNNLKWQGKLPQQIIDSIDRELENTKLEKFNIK